MNIRKNAALLLILVVILVGGCLHRSDISPSQNALVVFATAKCDEVPTGSRGLCEESIQRLVLERNLNAIAERNLDTQFDARRRLIAQYEVAAGRECRLGNESECARERLARTELAKLSMSQQEASASALYATKMYESAMQSLPALFALRDNDISVVCKVLYNDEIVCTALSSMLAYFDSEVSELLLSDIARLVEVYEIDPRSEILMACGPGVWGGAAFDGFAVQSSEEFLSILGSDETAEAALLGVCELVAGSSGGTDNTGSPGFSGLTGFDPWHGASICGFDVFGQDSDFEELINEFERMSEAFHEECEAAYWETVASGGDGGGGTDAGSDTGADTGTGAGTDDGAEDDLGETVTPNGDGTETVCTSHGCYVRYTNPGTASSHATQDDIQTTCTDDGTCVTDVSGLDHNNDPISVRHTIYPDGTEVTSMRGENRSTYGIHSPDGHRWYMDCRGSMCRDKSFAPGEDFVNPWDVVDYNDLLEFEEWLRNNIGVGMGDCVDEPCMSCGDYEEYMWEMKQGCADFGRSSGSCQAHMNEAECCSNSDAFPADPRVVMPTPDGGLACYGDVDVDFHSEACERRCQVAYGENCVDNCSSRGPAQVNFDLLDAICPMAISEACFSSAASPGIGQDLDPFGGVDPVPTSPSERVIFQPIQVLEPCGADLIGCGEVGPMSLRDSNRPSRFW